MVKGDIVKRLIERSGVSRDKAELVYEAFLHSLKGALARGDRIELRGFGVFTVRPRKTGVARNPKTGEAAQIPTGRVVRFKPGKELQPREKSGE